LKVDPNDIVAFGVAAEKLQADRQLVHQPELAFFKDFLLSWGAKDLPKANGNAADAGAGRAKAAGGSGGASVEDEDAVLLQGDEPTTSAKKPKSTAVDLDVTALDSDGEEAEVTMREMDLGAELEAELVDEEDKKKKPEADPELLPKDAGPFPLLPPGPGGAEPSDARKKVFAKIKQQAAEAIAGGNITKALDRYTEVIRAGGATALLMATRGAILLKYRRPCAAIRDCCAALRLNPDCGKAYHVRGVAHRKLGHWRKAHRDLSQGQRLDFSEDSVNVHMFVANKVGVTVDVDTKTTRPSAEGYKKAVELLFVDDDKKSSPSKKKSKEPAKIFDLRAGQAVRIGGLLKAPQLNNKRGIIQRMNPKDHERFDVELRLERGRVEVKAIKGENIVVVRAADAEVWKAEEAVHAEDRRRRALDEKRWLEQEESRKRMEEKKKASERSMYGDAFAGMDASERLEAEMSTLPLEEEVMNLLRRLRPEEALAVLKQVSVGGLGNMSGFIKIKVKQKLGEPDSEEEPVPAKVSSKPQSAPSQPRKRGAEEMSTRPPEDDDDDSEDEDFDRLPQEQEPLLDRGFHEPEPSEELDEKLAGWRREAMECFEDGDIAAALQKCTQANGPPRGHYIP
jgi:hypothetical protein